MFLKLTRLDVTDHGIFGRLETEGWACATLERHDIAIPVGEYPITIYDSPKHGNIPLLSNVPGRSMIEIHEGNWERQSLGCILVGRERAVIEGREGINASKDTLRQLIALITASPSPVYISIT